MSAMREELHHLVDLLPETGLRPAPGLIRAHAAGDHGPDTDLPFFASFEAGPDLAGRAEQILAPRNPAAEALLCDTGVLLAAGNIKDHAHRQ